MAEQKQVKVVVGDTHIEAVQGGLELSRQGGDSFLVPWRTVPVVLSGMDYVHGTALGGS